MNLKVLRSYSVKSKVIGIFSVIFLALSSLIALSFYSLGHLKNQFEKTENVFYKDIIALNHVQNLINKKSIAAKKFFVYQDDNSIKNYKEANTSLEKSLKDLEVNLTSESSQFVKPLTEAYKVSVSDMDKAVKNKKAYNKQVSGENSQAKLPITKLKKYIASSNLSGFYMIKVLKMENFFEELLRGKNNFALFNQEIKDIKERMINNGLDEARGLKINAGLKSFKQSYQNIAKARKKNLSLQKASDNSLDKLKTEIKLSINTLQDKMLEHKKNSKTNLQREVSIFTAVSLSIFGMIFGVIFYAIKLINTLVNDVLELKSISENFVKSCDKISSNSNQLSKIAGTQSNAIVNTSSSVNEITSMISKSNDAAIKSKDVSQANSAAAEQGKKTINEVLQAMDKLSSSSTSITSRFHKTSEELQDVVSIINQIGEKAKVINDIVFQTKLLSFNASVEVARAGEHGKGFSVVAEEIGNLASMSGTSAEEITKILDESIKKVTNIVQDNQTDIGNLVETNNSNISYGVSTVKECESALNQIIGNISTMRTSIDEIANASEKQNNGVRSISSAISNLSSSNQETLKYIQESNKHTSDIEENAHGIYQMAHHLENILTGKKKKKAVSTATVEFFDVPSDKNAA